MARGMGTGVLAGSGQALGAAGEMWLWSALEAQGYRVAYAGQKRGDLRCVNVFTGEVVKIEVKTARQTVDGKWRFTLWKAGKTDHRHADMVALLAVTASGRVIPFLVPVGELAGQRAAVISSHPERYAGKLARWRCSGEVRL